MVGRGRGELRECAGKDNGVEDRAAVRWFWVGCRDSSIASTVLAQDLPDGKMLVACLAFWCNSIMLCFQVSRL